MATNNPNWKRRQYMAAVVLGTAISALGAPPAFAEQTKEQNAAVVADISRYCTACWRNARLPADCWGDCTQEVLARLMQNIKPADWQRVFRSEGAERQEFIRAIVAVKKRTQRGLKRSVAIHDVIPDISDKNYQARREERAEVDQAAEDVLSERQQKIIRLSFEGWAVQDIADELGIGPERVSDEKYKAIRKLREHLQVG